MKNTPFRSCRGLTLAAVCALAAGPMLPARAQTQDSVSNSAAAASPGPADAARESRPSSSAGQNTVVVLPWIFHNGTSGAREKASHGIDQLLTESGFIVLPRCPRKDAEPSNMPDPGPATGTPPPAELPTLEQMLWAGRLQGVRYVLAGRASWHTRTAWGFLSTKTKSTCAVDIQIADVQTGNYTLFVRDVAMDSTASTSALKSAAGIIPYAGFAVGLVSAGPKTPEEQRAVLLATKYALKPWIDTWRQLNGFAQDQATAVAASGRRGYGKSTVPRFRER